MKVAAMTIVSTVGMVAVTALIIAAALLLAALAFGIGWLLINAPILMLFVIGALFILTLIKGI